MAIWQRFFDLRGKILLVLLIVGALSAATLAWIGFNGGRQSLTTAIETNLTAQRDIAKNSVERYFSSTRSQLIAFSERAEIRDALRDFARGYSELGQVPLSFNQEQRLRTFYENVFLPKLASTSEGTLVVDAFLPRSRTARALQADYLAGIAAEGAEVQVDQDGRYAGAVDTYAPLLRDGMDVLGFADMFLIGQDGRVLYSVLREPDFGTDLINGPFAESGLGRAFRFARDQRGSRFAHAEDYSFYRPSLGEPAAFITVPVYDGSDFLGVVGAQISAGRIEELLDLSAGDGNESEVVLVGADRLARTRLPASRSDMTAFLSTLRDQGMDAETLQRIERFRTPVLLQRLDGEAIISANRGETGIAVVGEDYAGRASLQAYAPLSIDGLSWSVVAAEPLSVAYAPIEALKRNIVVSVSLLGIAITIFSMIVSGFFTRPLRFLTDKANLAAGGEYDQTVTLARGDEFGELSNALQGLIDRLKARRDSAEEARIRTERLLDRFLPAGIVRDIKDRDPEAEGFNVAEQVPQVTIIHGQLTGYEGLMATMPPLEVIKVLDQLVQQVDSAVERNGIEKVRTVGGSYMAVAGLSAPLLDHPQRAVKFAQELRAIIQRFAAEAGAPINVHVGVASGPVVAGVIGSNLLSFDLWGEPVEEALALCREAAAGDILVARATAERVGDGQAFRDAEDKPFVILDTGRTN